jgi:hypothetical protein
MAAASVRAKPNTNAQKLTKLHRMRYNKHKKSNMNTIFETVLIDLFPVVALLLILLAIFTSSKKKRKMVLGDVWEIPAVINDSEGKDYVRDSKRYLENLGFEIIAKAGKYYRARAPKSFFTESQDSETYAVYNSSGIVFFFNKDFVLLNKAE